MNRKQGPLSLPSCVAWTASAIITSWDMQSLHSVEGEPTQCSFLMSAVGLIKQNKYLLHNGQSLQLLSQVLATYQEISKEVHRQ